MAIRSGFCHLLKKNNRVLLKKTIHQRSPMIPITNISTIFNAEMENEKKSFSQELPKIINSLQKNQKLLEMPEAAKWMDKMLQYNLIGGKNDRGLTTVFTYKIIEKENKINEETLRLAHTLGWCVEMFQAYCVILDDIMDGSTMRRGVPCWYNKPDVGLPCAINDSIIVYSTLLQILKNNFMNSPNYVSMFQLFNETLWHTSLGQHMDYITSQSKDFSLFTLDRYNTIIKHKTAYYTYYLPVSLGLLLVDELNPEVFQHAHDICIDIGTLFQIQDDYLDCFGDESLTGKAGTDIQERKCTWLAVNALLRCTQAQRVVFKTCYGSKEPAHIERIKQLYVQLRLPELYKQQEKLMYEDIIKQVNKLPDRDIKKLYYHLLSTTYERKQ